MQWPACFALERGSSESGFGGEGVSSASRPGLVDTRARCSNRHQEAEKAKLEEEKQRELGEIRGLQGRPQVRRRQHAEFRQSPDHPLPSPGRQAVPFQEDGAATPSWGTPPMHAQPDDESRHGRGHDTHRALEEGHTAPRGVTPGHVHVGEDKQVQWEASMRASRSPGFEGLTAADSNDVEARGRPPTSSLVEDEARGDGWCGMRESDGPRDPPYPPAMRGKVPADSDTVARADFDELTRLCRELLLEQRELRRKLEERDERDRQAQLSRREQARMPRSGLLAARQRSFNSTPEAGGVSTRVQHGGRRRVPSVQPSRISGGRNVGNVGHRGAGAKPGVAFGSTVPRRMEEEDKSLHTSAREPRKVCGVTGTHKLR